MKNNIGAQISFVLMVRIIFCIMRKCVIDNMANAISRRPELYQQHKIGDDHTKHLQKNWWMSAGSGVYLRRGLLMEHHA